MLERVGVIPKVLSRKELHGYLAACGGMPKSVGKIHCLARESKLDERLRRKAAHLFIGL